MKQKILMIMHLPPPVHGAAVMCQYLKDSNVINQTFRVDYINLSTSPTLNDIGKPGIHKVISCFKLLFTVFKSMLSKRYDLCYMTLTSSSAGFYKDVLVVFILKMFGKKILYHFHNKGVSAYSKRWFDHLLYKFAFRNSRTILLSPLLYFDIQKYVTPDQVFICPNGIPSESVSTAQRLGQTKLSCKFLFLSHMMVEKGVEVLLDACKILCERHVTFECHFVGSWSDISKESFEKMVRDRKLQAFVSAHGPKFGSQKKEFFESSDVFVLPTFYRSECFSLVLLEAMNYGLPIVSTHEGGIPDIVLDGETGFIVKQNDAHQLADKLEILSQQPELRHSFGLEAKRRFHEHFTISKFESNMENILSKAAVQRMR